ncbi:LuxR C-terminal-related transcriptional regulator [Microcoleus sp. Pol14D5]
MTDATSNRFDRLTLHYVGDDSQERAHFAQTALLVGHHCELYDSIDEIAVHKPYRGIIFLRDEPKHGGIQGLIKHLEREAIWLPVIAVGKMTDPQEIVSAVKAGALDFIILPVEADRLARCLTHNAVEAERIATIRRIKVHAKEKLDRLTPREAQVLELLSDGCSNKLMAREMGISPRTVEIHRANMMTKIGAANSASAMRLKLEAYER